jgi:hypothetical protein
MESPSSILLVGGFAGRRRSRLLFSVNYMLALVHHSANASRRFLPKIGARLLRAGSLVSAGADLAGAGGLGSLTSGSMSWLLDLIHAEDYRRKTAC